MADSGEPPTVQMTGDGTARLPGVARRRDPRVDLLRAAAIVLVLVWHLQPFAGFRSLTVSAPVFVLNVEVALLAVPLLFTVSLLLFFRRADRSPQALWRRLFRFIWLFAVFSALQWSIAFAAAGSLPRPTLKLLFMGGPPLPVVGDSVFYFLSVLILLTLVAWGFLRVPDRFKTGSAWLLIAVSAVGFVALSLAGVELPYWHPVNFIAYVGIAWLASDRMAQLARHAWLLLGCYVAAAALELLFMDYPIAPFDAPVGGMQREVYARVTLLFGVLAVLGLAGRSRVRSDPVVEATSSHSLGLYAFHKWVLLGVVAAVAESGAAAASGMRWLLVATLATAGTVAAVTVVDMTLAWRLVRASSGPWRPWRATSPAASAGAGGGYGGGGYGPWPVILVSLCAAAVVLLTAYRLFFGVTIYDEAFYAVLPYRWSQGAQPFVDELNLAQTFSLLTWPFVRLYTALTDGTTGIVLALRILYLAGATAVAGLAFVVLRRFIPSLLAALASLACIALVFFSIAAPSYNTIAAAALTVAMLLGLRGLLGPGRLWVWIGGAGFVQGLAVIAIPSAIVAVPVAAAALAVLGVKRRRSALLAYALGAAVPLGGSALLFALSGLEGVTETLSHSSTVVGMSAGFAERLAARAVQAFRLLVWPPVFPALVAILVAGIWLRARWYLLALVASPAVCAVWAWQAKEYYRLLDFIVLYALLAPVVAAGVVRGSGADADGVGTQGVVRVLMIWGFLPALAAGAAISYTSANGVPNAGVGLAPVVLITSTLLVMSFLRASPEIAVEVGPAPDASKAGDQTPARLRPSHGLMAAAALLQVVVVGLVLHYAVVFYDAPLPDLGRRVTSGPYKGLKTTADRIAELDSLTADLARLSLLQDQVAMGTRGRPVEGVCFIQCPAGYLFPVLPANTSSAWQFPQQWPDPSRADDLLRYYRRTGVWPLAVFEFRAAPSDDQNAPPCVLGDGYRVLAVRPWYALYVDERAPGGVW